MIISPSPSVCVLLSRVKAALRRSRIAEKAGRPISARNERKITADNIEIEISQHKVFKDEQEIQLSPMEFKLLAFLMNNTGQVFSREYILEKVWGYDYKFEG